MARPVLLTAQRQRNIGEFQVETDGGEENSGTVDGQRWAKMLAGGMGYLT
jgi:hypothetical protein